MVAAAVEGGEATAAATDRDGDRDAGTKASNNRSIRARMPYSAENRAVRLSGYRALKTNG